MGQGNETVGEVGMVKKTVTAKDRHRGMDVEEIRDALMGVPGNSVPEVFTTMRGKIRTITVVTQP